MANYGDARRFAVTHHSPWSRVEAALDELLELPETEWSEACARIAGDDAAFREEITAMLANTKREHPILDRRPSLTGPHSSDQGGLEAGTRIGVYRILGLIGRGGMGEVYRAERADGQYEQHVALKIVRSELADHPERFRAERQILAQLEHPGIARLLDGGVSERGQHYMVLELVDGVPITEWCSRHGCDLETRLRLFMAVCDAVAHAHRSLVVHRDIKPGNVLVTADGEVKLLDFGVAKLLSGSAEVTRNVPLTPEYSAPEQLTGGLITTATDVYALGMLLFELLSGELPWGSKDMAFGSAVRRILSETLPTLSRRAQKNPQPPVPPILLRGDLDAILAKALRREPAQRYATVNALRDDVARVLRHEPVAAREGARLYVIGRFIRRQRILVGSALIVLTVIIAGLIAVIWQAREALQQAHRAELESRKATAVKDFLLDIFKQSSVENPSGGADKVTAQQILDVGATRIKDQLRDQPQVREELMDTLAELNDDLGRTDIAKSLAADNLAELESRTGHAASEDEAKLEVRLAVALSNRSESAEAYRHLQRALESLRTLGELDSVVAAEAYLTVARAAYDGDQAEKAVGIRDLGLALDILKRRDPSNPMQGDVLEYLARYAKLDEDWAGAERWFNALLAFQSAQGLQRNAWAIGEAQANLGDFQGQIHHYDQAEFNLRRAVEILSGAAGANHPEAADTRARLGEVLFNAGHREDAAAMLNEALKSELSTPQGVDDSTETRKTLALLEFTRGRWSVAERLLRENLEQMKDRPAKELRYGISAGSLVALLIEEGRFEEAHPMYERSLDVYRRFIGEKSRAYAAVLDRGGFLALAENEPEPALALFQRVLTDWPRPAKGDFPNDYWKGVLGLAAADLALGNKEEARQRTEALLGELMATPRPSEFIEQEAQTRRLLGEALRRSARAADAETQLRRAVELRQSLDDVESPWLAQARLNLAECLIAEHQAGEARKLIALAADAESRQPSLNESYHREIKEARAMLDASTTARAR
jgi:eukaryotic-like serine/threonine-protein kinase